MELPGKKIIQNLGMARGITVRSRDIFSSIVGNIKTSRVY